MNESTVKAPIPGVIIDVKVSAGDTVEYGQELCVLEAMKMKNSIRSGKAGIISKVTISVGDQVSQNQTLMEYPRRGITQDGYWINLRNLESRKPRIHLGKCVDDYVLAWF